MRTRGKAAIIAGAVAAVLVVLLVVVPGLIDWDRYKGEISSRIEDSLGRKVTIAGPLRLRLLPSPALTAHDVAVANLPGARPETMASVKALSLRVRLLPLLRGNVVITSLVLDRPVVHLQRLPDGRANWRFSAPARPVQSPPTEARPAAPSEGGSRSSVVQIHSIEVNDGTLTWQSGAGAPLEVDGLNARLAMKSAEGPFAGKVSGRFRGVPVNIDASVDRLESDNASPLFLTVDLPSAETKLTLSGMLSALTDGRMVSGHLKLESKNLGRLSSALGGPADRLLAGPVTGEGNLVASSDEMSLKDLAVNANGTRATGSVSATLSGMPRVDVTLDLPSVDLDALLKNRPASRASAPASAPAPATQSSPAAIAAQGFRIPDEMFVNVGLSVGSASWRGGTIRQTRLDATLDEGEIVVTHLATQLPGDTIVTGQGTLASPQGHPNFDGRLETSSSDPRALLAWLGVDVSRVPGDRLRRFAAAARVVGDPAELALLDLDLTADGAHATGQVRTRLGDAKPSYAVTAAIDSLDLDAYLPKPAAPAPVKPEAASPVAGSATPPSPVSELHLPSDFDATVDVSAKRLIFRGVAADGVALAAALADGTLSVSKAEASVAGTRLSLSGALRSADGGQPRLDNVVFHLDSPQPGQFMRTLTGAPSAFLDRLGATTVDSALSGGLNALAAKVRATSAGMEMAADGTVGDVLTSPRYQIALSARAADAAQALGLLSAGYRPSGPLGAFSAAATLTGQGQTARISDLDLRVGNARVTGSAQAETGGARPTVTATLAGGTLDLDPFLPAERGGVSSGAAPARHHAHSKGGRNGALPLAVVPVAARVTTGGGGAWSAEPLDLSFLRSVDARVDAHADSVSWKGWRLASPQAHLVIDNGVAQLDKLTGKLLGGDMALAVRLADGAAPQLSGDLSVAGADLSKAKLGSGSIQLTQGIMDTTAKFAASGGSPADMVSHLNGDGRFTIRNGVVAGFDLPAVNQQVQHIQNAVSLLNLAQAALSGGETRFSSLAGTARAQNGVVATHDTKLDAQGGTATAEAEADLPRWMLNSRIDFRLADSNAPPLGLRFEGPLDNPRKIIDINALERYLVERGLGRALKGKGGSLQDLLGGLTGKPQQPQQPQQPGQPAPPPQPSPQQKLLQDLLKGLGGK